MKKVLFTVLVGLAGCAFKTDPDYSISDIPWNEELGNHRAVVRVDDPANAVSVEVFWRRHDKDPEKRRFMIIHESGDTVQNIRRIQVNDERCHLVFGPVKSGTHFFYYLPFEVQEGNGSYSRNYLAPERPPDPDWVAALPGNTGDLPAATCTSIQARTAFDSFFPMEVIATGEEKKAYTEMNKGDYQLFAEDRRFPVRMKDNIPSRWLDFEQPASFSGKAIRNEYYVFQVALWASAGDIDDVEMEFGLLESDDSAIQADAFTCFNTDGVDPYGKHFRKKVHVPKGQVQSFWIGLDIPENVVPGSYRGYLKVRTANAGSRNVRLEIEVDDEVVADRGDGETWRHSRLRWLNSTAGMDDKPVAPYDSIRLLEGGVIGLSGKKVVMNDNGLPKSIEAYGNEILRSPIEFVVESLAKTARLSEAADVEVLETGPGVHAAIWTGYAGDLEIKGSHSVESDGWINITLKAKAINDIKLKDIRLEIPFRKEMATYMMGMGLPGQYTPVRYSAPWEGPHDSFWIGNVKGGLHCELRGAEYSGPLLNLYKPMPPASWYNGGKGGFKVSAIGNETRVVVYSGERLLKAGEEIEYEFALIITPVKKLDTKSQFVDRYHHGYPDPEPKQEDLASGIRIVNVHHANRYNPHINYPFIAVDEMKDFVNRWHEKGTKVKVYYTIRELTNYTTEIWALRSLGNEILGDGHGGGYPWLREHLVEGYHPQWYDRVDSVTVDASILTAAGESRWYNYYIEGLKWLVANADIDGLYLDDVAYDRDMLKRIRKVMDAVKPGCLLDLHSNTGFSRGPAIQYADFFPYLDKLWFGESFDYDRMSPENWLVEVSGIPFGLMGDMLHAGGNPWRGMVYGMTVRYPWFTEGVTCDPREIWKVWDAFGIEEAKLIGYWEQKTVVSTNNPDVKATAYVKEGKLLVAVASWAKEAVKVKLSIDWHAVGLDRSNVKMCAPEIESFQPEQLFSTDDEISIDPAKGWLLVIE